MKSFRLSDRKSSRGLACLPARQAGDTIVEVMVSIALLAFAMGGAYVLSNRSLRTAVEANQRKEATAIAQGQIELLRNAYRNNPGAFPGGGGVYEIASPAYCLVVGAASPPPATSGSCTQYDGSQYRVSVYWDAGGNKDFSITVYWDNINGRGPPFGTYSNQSTLTAYYRTPS